MVWAKQERPGAIDRTRALDAAPAAQAANTGYPKEVCVVKFMVMMKRKQGLSREDFRRYYEEVHAPAALKRFPIRKYVRNYVVVPPGAPEPDFDCITEFWYDTMEDAISTARTWKHHGGLGDETSFIEATREVSFQVEEGISA